MVLSTSGGKSPSTSASRPGTRHGVSRGLDAGAKGCPVSEKEGPFSEELAREGLSRGAWVPGTRSGWANRAQLARPAPRPPWLCTRSVQVGSLGETHTCEGPGASCAPVHLCRVSPQTGSRTTGSGRFLARQTGLPEPRRTPPKSAGPPGGGVATLLAAQLVRARRPHGWAHQGHEWREATSDASDSKGGDGGRVATYDGSADLLDGWCTQRSQYCPNGPAHACPVTAPSGGPGQGILLATRGSWCANAVGGPSTPLTLPARCTWPPSRWQRHPWRLQHAGTPALGLLLPEETRGLTMGWRFGGIPEWLPLDTCRVATPISGLGHEASAEAVSYEASRAGLLPLRPPYAPGASEKVSVGPLSCPWMYSGSSTPTEHVPLWGVLTVRPNPTPYREKRSSALGRVCSFPSWPEGPTGWGDWAPNPCVRITVPETEREWASRRNSWGCGCPVLSWEQGLPPRLSWRRGETGPARRVGPCTDMLDPRTQSAETACVEEESRHESTRPSGRSLQTNLGDGRTRKCVSAWASWTVACEGSDSKLADPRSVVTHHFSWVQWSKGCKTLTSYRQEGPALSRPSPVGLRSPHARHGYRQLSLKWSGHPWTWGDAGRTESHSRAWWSEWANETDWGALTRLAETAQVGPRGPPAYPQWGSEVERRDAARGALLGRRPVAGSECAVQHLPGSTAGQGVQERLGRPSRTARCCPLATEEVDESGEVLLLPLLSEPSSDPEMTETALLLKIWVPLAAGPAAEQKEKTKDLPPGPPPGEGAVQSPSPEEQSQSSPGRPS